MGSFSNNNYLPNIGQYNPNRPDMIGLPYVSPSHQSLPAYPGNFTFAVPTQASNMTSVMSQTALPRSLYSSHMPFGLAPGIGASWQHSVPNHMPWSEINVQSSRDGGVTTFTGMSHFVFTPTISSNAITTPRPSCSASRFRNKRRATEDLEAGAPDQKVFLSEEKMADKMRGLSLNNHRRRSGTKSSLPDLVLSSEKKSEFCGRVADGYNRLREIEDRLLEDIDEESGEVNDSDSDKPLIHLHQSLRGEFFTPDPILPKKIIQDLNKPCLQVVLWKPPGGFCKDIVSDQDELSASSSQDISSHSGESNQTIPRNSSFSSLTGDMDTDDNSSIMDSDIML